MAKGYPDFEGQKSKLYTVADWAAFEAVDKNFYAGAAGLEWTEEVDILYTVPVGKTLYITHLALGAKADEAAAADSNQICLARLRNETLATILYTLGGNGGAQASLLKPIVIGSGEQVKYSGINNANHVSSVRISIGGYEV